MDYTTDYNMDYTMGGYGTAGEYKPPQTYGNPMDQNSAYIQHQAPAPGAYPWGNQMPTNNQDYSYGYGTSTAGYEDYSAGYDYGYGSSQQEQWDNTATNYQPFQAFSSEMGGANYPQAPGNIADNTGFGFRGRGIACGGVSDRGRGAASGGFSFGTGNNFGGDNSRATADRGVGGRGGADRSRGGANRGRGGAGRGVARGGQGDRGAVSGANKFGTSVRGKFGERGGRGTNRGGVGASRGGQAGSDRGGTWRGGQSSGRGRGRGSSVASASRVINLFEPVSPYTPLTTFIERWKTFASGFTDCGNAVSNIECSLKACKINYLQLNFDCKFLTKVATYSIFTGVLNINKLSATNTTLETIFVARGMGLSKKSAKMDCYEKAYKLLSECSVQEFITQKDYGEQVLIQEARNTYRDNPQSFMDMLKKSNALAAAEGDPPKPKPLLNFGDNKGPAAGGGSRKRISNTRPGGEVKKGKFSDHLMDVLENKHLSLAPTKKVGILLKPTDSLFTKLTKLKELLKEEGITKLHIVPKIDQIAHKTAIHIQNVYRFQDVPILGFENKMPVYCEIYFDDVFMADGAPDFKRNQAMLHAYNNLASILYMKPLEEIVTCPNVWRTFMAGDPDIFNVVTKWQGEDNNSLLTSNLANMKQMMQSMPDVTLPIERMVLTEHESDKDIQNVFKALELSATRNLMLLECEIVRDPDMKFTCSLSLQGRLLASRTHLTKNGAKRICSEVVMNGMKKKHDSIFVTTEFIGHTITRQELIQKAMRKKAEGLPPVKIFYKKQENKEDPKANTLEAKMKQEEDRRRNEQIENLPENIQVRPLIPWMAAVMYDIIDDYYKKITLEDLMVNVSEMTKSQRDMVTACASKMGLRVITKLKAQHDSSLLRRTVTAQDMSKILQLHGGQSGRYKLVQCVNPYSQEELNKFKQECLHQHQLLVDARIKDDPEADEPQEANSVKVPPGTQPTEQMAKHVEGKIESLAVGITPPARPVMPLMATNVAPRPQAFRPPKPPMGPRFLAYRGPSMYRTRF